MLGVDKSPCQSVDQRPEESPTPPSNSMDAKAKGKGRGKAKGKVKAAATKNANKKGQPIAKNIVQPDVLPTALANRCVVAPSAQEAERRQQPPVVKRMV